MRQPLRTTRPLTTATGVDGAPHGAREILGASRTNELFLAVVGPVGAGAGTAAEALCRLLEGERFGGINYEVHVIKASACIKEWAQANGRKLPNAGRKTLDGIETMQDLGDEIRQLARDNAAVARMAVGRISERRAEASGLEKGRFDGRPRVFVVDSLRHPAEAHLLRRVYREAFTLVGVVCDEDERERRLTTILYEPRDWKTQHTRTRIHDFMKRDADASDKHGQHVVDTFHEADFFVDNSLESGDVHNTAMNDQLARLVGLLAARGIERPRVAEKAMHHAFSAKLQSACLSRQVGAAIANANGDIIATGTNEVPKAGGGVYGEAFGSARAADERCAFRETVFCSSNVEQNKIIDELIDDLPELAGPEDRSDLRKRLRATSIGGLLEFLRAVHAEMDAILSAARTGASPRGCRLFVSTFPCHYCARHIVAAGIDEVQYIEPYPKSRALRLHSDSITTDPKGWTPPSTSTPPATASDLATGRIAPKVPKVLFRPFVGVAPRMYARVFMKDRDYKDRISGDYLPGEPEWGGSSDLIGIDYGDLELKLADVATVAS